MDGARIGYISLCVAAFGGYMVYTIWTLRRRVVRVCDGGLSIGPESNPELCPWSEVELIREIFTRGETYLGGGMTYSEPVRRFSVYRADGRRFHFSEKDYGEVLALGEHLRGARRDHNLEWEEVEMPGRR